VNLLRNLLALIGVLALVLAGAAILLLEPYANKSRGLDEVAFSVYSSLLRTVLRTGDVSGFLVYSKQVPAGIDIPTIEMRLAEAAAAANLASLGALSADRQVQERLGREFPLLRIYLFCDPALANELIRHNPSLAAFLPCRIILHADDRGPIWLMTPNLDLALHGGHPLPHHLRERAQGLQAALRRIVDQATNDQATNDQAADDQATPGGDRD